MHKIAAVIPALNEEETITEVVTELLESGNNGLKISRVIVCDNGSTDETAKHARDAGAEVVLEKLPGYGAACLRALKEIKDEDVVIFIDADGSSEASEWIKLVQPIFEEGYDFVIGSRLIEADAAKTLEPHQRFGNKLASFLISMVHGQKFSDLGPFRAIKREALEALNMQDKDFGWTVEMQIKALRYGLKCIEVPVSNSVRKAGVSKISGTMKGSFLAGKKILTLVFKDLLRI